MKGFYQVTETIKNQLLSDVNVNTVTTGDITNIDLSKQTIFPLSHIMIDSVTIRDNTLDFSLSILAIDIVDVSKEPVVDVFIGNNNEQDILNTQLAVLNKLSKVLGRGQLYQDLYQLEGDPVLSPKFDFIENQLAGWEMTLQISINNDISIC
jgi:hypothetical protein